MNWIFTSLLKETLNDIIPFSIFFCGLKSTISLFFVNDIAIYDKYKSISFPNLSFHDILNITLSFIWILLILFAQLLYIQYFSYI